MIAIFFFFWGGAKLLGAMTVTWWSECLTLINRREKTGTDCNTPKKSWHHFREHIMHTPPEWQRTCEFGSRTFALWHNPCVMAMEYMPGNNFPGIASQFATHIYINATQNFFCLAVFLHRSVQNFIWNNCPPTQTANQLWGRKVFPVCAKKFGCVKPPFHYADLGPDLSRSARSGKAYRGRLQSAAS